MNKDKDLGGFIKKFMYFVNYFCIFANLINSIVCIYFGLYYVLYITIPSLAILVFSISYLEKASEQK